MQDIIIFREAPQNDQDQNAEQHRAIYEDIENPHYLTVEGEDNEMTNDDIEMNGHSDVISILHVESINQNIYEEINSAYYEDADWRNSIISSEESCTEQDFVNFNIDNTQNDVVEDKDNCLYPMVLFDKNKVHHEKSESDDIHNQSIELSVLPEKTHLYFTVLSDD